ncbi:MAG: XRE family transcriptional regulator [archaeon]|nr:XRE family transcriptional regulator [archaeon]
MSDKTKEYGEKLRNLLEKNNMNQRDLAKKLYLTDTAVSNYLAGKRLPRYEITVQIAKLFNVTADYLLGIQPNKIPKEIESETIKIPVFRNIKYNDTLSADNQNVEYFINVARAKYSNRNRLFAKIVTTNQMETRIMLGDTIIFEEFNLGVDQIYNGDICLVSKGDDYALIREIATKDNVFCFNLLNVTMPPRMYTIEEIRKENINIIARAVTLIHDFPDRKEK